MFRIQKVVTLCTAVAALQACGGSSSGPQTPAPEGGGVNTMQPQNKTTGAVSTLSPGDSGRHSSVLDQVLQGRVPGLEVVNTDTGVRTISIRGMNRGDSPSYSFEPLLILDGMPQPVGTGALMEALKGISMDEVDKIQVLRSASELAIYGTRGSSGVIKITLKN